MQHTLLAQELGSLSAHDAAGRLIGSKLSVNRNGQILSGTIIETEAYDESDPASHSFKGVTQRNHVMFGPPGRAYVYFTYGMHYCLNVVVGRDGSGAAVLIRALKPLTGIEAMRQLRATTKDNNLLNGPAKLTKGLDIDITLNGHDLSQAPLRLELLAPLNPEEISWTKRIGIREENDRELYWRACLKNSLYLSRSL